MSVERVVRKDGSVVWRVRWRQAGRNRSKVLGRKCDAEAFDAEIARRKRTGEPARLDAGKEPLAQFGEEWWRLHTEPNLARLTLKGYASIWDAHVLPRLGSVPLRELTPDVVNRFRLELEADGVGPTSIRKSLVLLQGVLQRACEWGRLASNPAAVVRKPVPPRARTIVPLAPERVEAIRLALLGCGRVRDATLVSVLAYAGLRPGEALALRWTQVRERTLLVEGAVSFGAIDGTKTGRSRTVRIPGEPCVGQVLVGHGDQLGIRRRYRVRCCVEATRGTQPVVSKPSLVVRSGVWCSTCVSLAGRREERSSGGRKCRPFQLGCRRRAPSTPRHRS
jgi:hypothetical protein